MRLSRSTSNTRTFSKDQPRGWCGWWQPRHRGIFEKRIAGKVRRLIRDARGRQGGR